MQYELNSVDPVRNPGWDDMLLSRSDYSFFHSTAWASVLSNSYAYTPRYLTFVKNNEFLTSLPFMEITSYLTGKRGISLPFSDYCDPIVHHNTDHDKVIDALIKFGKAAGWKYFEIRGSNGLFTDIIPSAKFYCHLLKLSDHETAIWGKLRDSTRRNIEKAIKQGVQIHFGNSENEVNEYYHLHCLTRKYHGLPPQPLKFFKNIYKYILSKNMGIVILATYQEHCIAGNIYFHFGKKSYYKYGASNRTYQRYRASNLVMWEAIKYYSQHSYESLCFGRTDMNDAGLMQFKNGWGAECRVIKYHRYDLDKDKFINGEFAVHHNMAVILKHLPLSFLKIMGTFLYRHIG
ncbi:peptidoglycan bridge formation glycyltransferase FemA/FemB family protein [candidate division KSB1 bacterium]|nr:peptidoglycan bridge formation glycyltransferase FemA/FemB family protein [candidate division KSB1 bacterium]